MIFQEPMTALNPVLTIGRQLTEGLMAHRRLTRSAAEKRAVDWLARVGVPGGRNRLRDYPHRLSGGMRQRIVIAMAMICGPSLVIADEPTTALDVSIQAQILSLMLSLKQEMGTALLLISHDLGVIAQTAARVVVMYAGQVVESADTLALFEEPFHPYTQGLLASIPRPERQPGRPPRRLKEIRGAVPALLDIVPGCRFARRCPHVFSLCRRECPPLTTVAPHHLARCWLEKRPELRRPDV
jgi:oligopeptide/dipeptide ABC transporter ATP-binding protein